MKKKRGQHKGRQANRQALDDVRTLLVNMPRRKDLLIECLHRIQDHYHGLSSDHLTALAQELKLSLSTIFEVASFYHHFDIVKETDPALPSLTVRVCQSISCEMQGANELLDHLKRSYGTTVRIQSVPCVGRCDKAPVAVVANNPITHASAEKISLAVKEKAYNETIQTQHDCKEYVNAEGYRILDQLHSNKRSIDETIETLESSSLRGLGGAGFPTGKKWRIVRSQAAPKLLVVNLDEGEPGTFKDRYYLENNPHQFLEGMLIAAHCVGVEQIYLYLRDEYASCRQILHREIAAMQEHLAYKLPNIHLRRGAGAYVCGEESALIESIEGKRGMPRLRPPYVAEKGLFERPTLVHNMETLYWVPVILSKGIQWFDEQGRHGCKGIRSFSVSGRVNKPGVHLAPAGITVTELINEYCGGMQAGHTFYGYLPGGASGGLLPASLGNLPLDFDTLNEYGCFIGSAAVIVLSDKDKARDIALNAMRFFEHESCGQCTPCRSGTRQAALLMEDNVWDTARLTDLAQVMQDASICGLGQAAPNPMLSVLKYFPDEVTDVQ